MDRSSTDPPSQPHIKSERASDSPLPRDGSSAPYNGARLSQNTPLPSTERADAPGAASVSRPSSTKGIKKRGVANVKKTPKRPKKPLQRNGGPKRKNKQGAEHDVPMGEDGYSDEGGGGADADEDGEESDHGPYCLCRGPDDHRWMICCESCDDWFHGECINLDKSIGESLIEKFVCPNCTTATFRSVFKKTCSLPSCRKPARIALGARDEEEGEEGASSVFCSDEHAQVWWERMVARLPTKRKAEGQDAMAQEEFMALLESGLAGFDEDGMWRLTSDPFKSPRLTAKYVNGGGADVDLKDGLLSSEEEVMIRQIQSERTQLATEKDLSRKMLHLIDLAADRRRTAIQLGHFSEDICGYDDRLDTVSSRDAFAAYAASAEGLLLLAPADRSDPSDPSQAPKLGDPLGVEAEADGQVSATRGMCPKKRCQAHRGWAKMLALGVRHQMKEIEVRMEELSGLETMVRGAAAERARRKGGEKNWVEVL